MTVSESIILFNTNTNYYMNLDTNCKLQIKTCYLNNKTYPLTPDLHWYQYLHLCILYWFTGYRIHATCRNKWLHHFLHATLYTTTFLVYPLLTTSTLYWIIMMPLPQTPHGHLTANCVTFGRSPLVITLVLFIFTLMPLFSTLSFHSLSLLINTLSNEHQSMMI